MATGGGYGFDLEAALDSIRHCFNINMFVHETSYLVETDDRRYLYLNGCFPDKEAMAAAVENEEELVAALRRNPGFKLTQSHSGKWLVLVVSLSKEMPTETETLETVADAMRGRGWKWIHPNDEESFELLFGDLPRSVTRRRIRCPRSLRGLLRTYEKEFRDLLSQKVPSLESDGSSQVEASELRSSLDNAIVTTLKSCTPTTLNSRIKITPSGKAKLFFKNSWLRKVIPDNLEDPALQSKAAFLQHLYDSPLYYPNQDCVHLRSYIDQVSPEPNVCNELAALLILNGEGMKVDLAISMLSKPARMRVRNAKHLQHCLEVNEGRSWCRVRVQGHTLYPISHKEEAQQRRDGEEQNGQSNVPIVQNHAQNERESQTDAQSEQRDSESTNGEASSPLDDHIPLLPGSPLVGFVDFIEGDLSVLNIPGKGKALMHRSYFTSQGASNLSQHAYAKCLNNGYPLFLQLSPFTFEQFSFIVIHGWKGKRSTVPTAKNPKSTTVSQWKMLKSGKNAQEEEEASDLSEDAASQEDAADTEGSVEAKGHVIDVYHAEGFVVVRSKEFPRVLVHKSRLFYRGAHITQSAFYSHAKVGSYIGFVSVQVQDPVVDCKHVAGRAWIGQRPYVSKHQNVGSVLASVTKLNIRAVPEEASSNSDTVEAGGDSQKELYGDVSQVHKERGFAVVDSPKVNRVLVHKSRLYLHGSKIEGKGNPPGSFESNVRIGMEVGFVAVKIDQPLQNCSYVAGRAWIGEKPPIAEKQVVDSLVKELRKEELSEEQSGFVTQVISRKYKKGNGVVKDSKGREVYFREDQLFLDGVSISNVESGFFKNVNVGTRMGFLVVKEGGHLWAEPAWIGVRPSCVPVSIVDSKDGRTANSKTATAGQTVTAKMDSSEDTTDTDSSEEEGDEDELASAVEDKTVSSASSMQGAMKRFSPDDIMEGVVIEVLDDDFAVLTATRSDVHLGMAVLHRDQMSYGGDDANRTGMSKESFAFFVKKRISLEFRAVRPKEDVPAAMFVCWSAWVAGSNDWPGGDFDEDYHTMLVEETILRWRHYYSQRNGAAAAAAVASTARFTQVEKKTTPQQKQAQVFEPKPAAVPPKVAKVEEIRGDFAILRITTLGGTFLMHRAFFTKGEDMNLDQKDFSKELMKKDNLFVRPVKRQFREFSGIVEHGWKGKKMVIPNDKEGAEGKTIRLWMYSISDKENETDITDLIEKQKKSGRKVFTDIKRSEVNMKVSMFFASDNMALVSLDKSFTGQSHRATALFPRYAFSSRRTAEVTKPWFRGTVASDINDYIFILVESLLPDVDYVVLSAGSSPVRKAPTGPPHESDIVLYSERVWLKRRGGPGKEDAKTVPKEEEEVMSDRASTCSSGSTVKKNEDPFHHGRVIQLIGNDFAVLSVKDQGRVLVHREAVTREKQASVRSDEFAELCSTGNLVTMHVRSLPASCLDSLGFKFAASHAFFGARKALPVAKAPVEHTVGQWIMIYEEAKDKEAPSAMQTMGLLKIDFSPFFPCQAYLRSLVKKLVRGSPLLDLDLKVSRQRPKLFNLDGQPSLAIDNPFFVSSLLKLHLPISNPEIFEDKEFVLPFLACGVPRLDLNSVGELLIKGLRGYCVGRKGSGKGGSPVAVALFGPEGDESCFEVSVPPALFKIPAGGLALLHPVILDVVVTEEEDFVVSVSASRVVVADLVQAETKLRQALWARYPDKFMKAEAGLTSLTDEPSTTSGAQATVIAPLGASALDYELMQQREEGGGSHFEVEVAMDDEDAVVLPADDEEETPRGEPSKIKAYVGPPAHTAPSHLRAAAPSPRHVGPTGENGEEPAMLQLTQTVERLASIMGMDDAIGAAEREERGGGGGAGRGEGDNASLRKGGDKDCVVM